MTAYRLSPGGRLHECDHATCRPVVVIDPDDTEAVERLHRLYLDERNGWQRRTHDGSGSALGFLTAALREFAAPTPPKPDEPQGLGAVVLDEHGRHWVRTNHGPTPWYLPNFGAAAWTSVHAVGEPLNEGVTP